MSTAAHSSELSDSLSLILGEIEDINLATRLKYVARWGDFFPGQRRRRRRREWTSAVRRIEVIGCVADPVTIKQREMASICDLPYTRPVCVPYSSVYTELTRCFTDHHSGEGSDTLWRSPRPDFNSPDADERDADWNSAYIKCNILTCSPRLRSRNHGKVAFLFLTFRFVAELPCQYSVGKIKSNDFFKSLLKYRGYIFEYPLYV